MRLITQNLIKFVKAKRLTDKAFEEEVGWSNGFYGKVKAGKIAFSIEKLRSIVDRYPELNIHWLCTGLGDMLILDPTNHAPDILKEHQLLHAIKVELEILDIREHHGIVTSLEGTLAMLKRLNDLISQKSIENNG